MVSLDQRDFGQTFRYDVVVYKDASDIFGEALSAYATDGRTRQNLMPTLISRRPSKDFKIFLLWLSTIFGLEGELCELSDYRHAQHF